MRPYGLGLLLAAFLLTACENTAAEGSDAVERAAVIEQATAGERVWAEEVLPGESVDVTRPLYIAGRIRPDGRDLLITDFGTMSVLRFTPGGEHLATYGRGRGRGPGELLQVMDAAVRGDEVWLPDINTRTASWFDRDGTYRGRIDLDFEPLRMVALEDGFAFMTLGEDLFRLVTREGEVVRSFGRLVEDQIHGDRLLRMSGALMPGAEGGFIFAPWEASYLYYYSADGELERRVATVQGLDWPEIRPEERGGLAPVRHGRAVDANVDPEAGLIYQLVAFAEDGSERYTSMALDVYDWRTGAYRHSYRLPFIRRAATKLGDRIYAVRDTTFAVYEIR